MTNKSQQNYMDHTYVYSSTSESGESNSAAVLSCLNSAEIDTRNVPHNQQTSSSRTTYWDEVLHACSFNNARPRVLAKDSRNGENNRSLYVLASGPATVTIPSFRNYGADFLSDDRPRLNESQFDIKATNECIGAVFGPANPLNVSSLRSKCDAHIHEKENECSVTIDNPNKLSENEPVIDSDAGNSLYEVQKTNRQLPCVCHKGKTVTESSDSSRSLYHHTCSHEKGTVLKNPRTPYMRLCDKKGKRAIRSYLYRTVGQNRLKISRSNHIQRDPKDNVQVYRGNKENKNTPTSVHRYKTSLNDNKTSFESSNDQSKNQKTSCEKCAADSTSKCEANEKKTETLFEVKCKTLLDLKPALLPTTVAMPTVDTRCTVLSTIANPVMDTSFSSLSKIARPDVSITNNVLETLSSKKVKYSQSLYSFGLKKSKNDENSDKTIEDMLDASKSLSIIPAFADMVKVGRERVKSMGQPTVRKKQMNLKRRNSEVSMCKDEATVPKRQRLEDKKSQEMCECTDKYLAGFESRHKLTEDASNLKDSINTTSDYLTSSVNRPLYKSQSKSLTEHSQLEMHKQYLKVKQDLLSIDIGSSCYTPTLPMHQALLPAPTWLDNLENIFQEQEANDQSANAESIGSIKSVPVTLYGPTCADYEAFKEAQLHKVNTKEKLISGVETSKENISSTPDSTVDTSSCENSRDKVDDEFIVTPDRDNTSELFDDSGKDISNIEQTIERAVEAMSNDDCDNVTGTPVHVPPQTDVNLSESTTDSQRSMFEDLVNGILADESLITNLPESVPDIGKDLPFTCSYFDGLEGYISDGLMSADEDIDHMVDLEVEGSEEMNQHSEQIDCPPSGKNQYREYCSARVPAKLGYMKKHRFEKRFPPKYLKSKPQKGTEMQLEKRSLCAAAERFLGDFNDKDKRACREKVLGQKNHTSKGKIATKVTQKKEKEAPSVGKTANSKNIKHIKEDKEKHADNISEPRVTRTHTAKLKQVMTREPEVKSKYAKKDAKPDIKQRDGAEQMRKHNGKKMQSMEKPKVPALKLQSVKEVKNKLKKMWSIKRAGTGNNNKPKLSLKLRKNSDKNSQESKDSKTAHTVKQAHATPNKSKAGESGHKNGDHKHKLKETTSGKTGKKTPIVKTGTTSDQKKTNDTMKKKVATAKLVSPTVPVINCKLCTFVTMSREDMERHYSRQHPRWCFKCDRIFKSIEALKLHLKKNHDTLIYCSICDSKFFSKYGYHQHLKTQIHFNHVERLKSILGMKQMEDTSVTLVISSDENDDEGGCQDVYIVEDNDVKTEDESNDGEPNGRFKNTARAEFLRYVDIMKEKVTDEGTKCIICKLFYKRFQKHCKTSKHILNFETSAYFKKLKAEDSDISALLERMRSADWYRKYIKTVQDKTVNAWKVKVHEIVSEEDPDEETKINSNVPTTLEDSGIAMDTSHNEDLSCYNLMDYKTDGSRSDPKKSPEQLTIRYRPIYRSPILTSRRTLSDGKIGRYKSHDASQHHVYRYSSPNASTSWGTTGETSQEIASLDRTDYKPLIERPRPTPVGNIYESRETMCSPTMLVKNVSSQMELTGGTFGGRQNIFDSFSGDNIKNLSPAYREEQDDQNTLNATIDQIVKNKERIETIKKERIERSKQSPSSSITESIDENIEQDAETSVHTGDVIGITQVNEVEEPIMEGFCVIENVETLSKESFQLLFDNKNENCN